MVPSEVFFQLPKIEKFSSLVYIFPEGIKAFIRFSSQSLISIPFIACNIYSWLLSMYVWENALGVFSFKHLNLSLSSFEIEHFVSSLLSIIKEKINLSGISDSSVFSHWPKNE